jgi:hypothetical protein
VVHAVHAVGSGSWRLPKFAKNVLRIEVCQFVKLSLLLWSSADVDSKMNMGPDTPISGPSECKLMLLFLLTSSCMVASTA